MGSYWEGLTDSFRQVEDTPDQTIRALHMEEESYIESIVEGEEIICVKEKQNTE